MRLFGLVIFVIIVALATSYQPMSKSEPNEPMKPLYTRLRYRTPYLDPCKDCNCFSTTKSTNGPDPTYTRAPRTTSNKKSTNRY